MTSPYFIGLGAQKSGTSWLYACMYEHPELCIPVKDLHFFSRERNWKNGINWYESLFDKFSENDKAIIGHISADCAFNNGSIERLKLHVPNAKLIFVIRHPIDRAYSLYWHQYRMGREYRSFEKAV